MEATLLYFMLDVAHSVFAHITQHFAQHPFECVASHGSTLWAFWWRDGIVAVVTNVECGAEEVAALFGSISITLLQASHIGFCTQDTRDDNLVQGDAFYVKAVEIVASYCREQLSGSRNEVRNAVSHPFVEAVEGIGSYVEEFVPTVFCLLTVANRTDAPLLCGHYLHVLNVRETGCIRRDATDGMPLHAPVRSGWQAVQHKLSRFGLSTTVVVLEFPRGGTGVSTACVLLSSTLPVTPGNTNLTAPSSSTAPPNRPKNIFFFSLLIAIKSDKSTKYNS